MSKYIFIIKMGLQMSLTYRLNYVISILSSAFPILLQVMLWHAVFSYTGAEKVYGYTYPEMMAYTLFALLIGQALRTGFEYEVATDIKDGGLNRFLIQPLSYLGYRLTAYLGNNISYFLVTLVLIGLCGIGLTYWLDMTFELKSFLCLLLVLCAAFMIQFFLFYMVGLVAFWAHEVWGVFESVRIVGLVLSGGIFPLTVFGETGMQILSYLPFQYVIFFPIEVVLGRVSDAEVLHGFMLQLFGSACCGESHGSSGNVVAKASSH
ncbi:ABC transporter permease [Veronia pacifica]|uniref:ABC transporter permease n=1 Tax=Veronia pacifica TaxID=1080227 RepID=A0A1C3EIK9_9GAMM|nr:ABC-2 family transporter protein [Veronia pacifica]ODA33067.1 hypothetical protein A8L45_11520 [Veronia pacifica]